jgi:DNA-binding transcriptional MerR regulator
MTPEEAVQGVAQAWNIPVIASPEPQAPQTLTMTALVDALGGPGRGGGTRAAATILGVNIRSVQRYLAGERGNAKETHGANTKLLAQKLDTLNSAIQERDKQAQDAANEARELVKQRVTDAWGNHVSAKASGDLLVSSDPEWREHEQFIDTADLDAFLDDLLDGDFTAAAKDFDTAFTEAWDFADASWSEYDSLDISAGY